MVEITIDEAKNRLMTVRPGLYAGFVSGSNDWLNAYENHGVVIVKRPWYNNPDEIIYFTCDVGNSDADLNLVLEELGEVSKIMWYIGEYPSDQTLCFSCIGTPYEDSSIRPLTENDREQVMVVTNVPDNDTEFGKGIAINIKENFSTVPHVLGIFANTELAGIITLENINNGEVIKIINVFVPLNFRGRGYAPRLIRAATAMYPGALYEYNCYSTNHASAAAAKSAGYIFEGTHVWL